MNFDENIKSYIALKQNLKSLQEEINSQIGIQNSMHTYNEIQKELLQKDLDDFQAKFQVENQKYTTLIHKVENRYKDFTAFESDLLQSINTTPVGFLSCLKLQKQSHLRIPKRRIKGIIAKIRMKQFEFEQIALTELKAIKENIDKELDTIHKRYEETYTSATKIVDDRLLLLNEKKAEFTQIQQTLDDFINSPEFAAISEINDLKLLEAIKAYIKDTLDLLHINKTTTAKRNTYSKQIDEITTHILKLKENQ